ncbi:MAG: hypothetical protein VB078_07190 [Clostridiaceae bacterium]|nr:hypothetical protein [Clostridiaceae bacterium]
MTKRLLALAIALIAVFFLSSCGDAAEISPPETENENPSPEMPPDPTTPGGSVEPPSGSTAINDTTWMIDLSYLTDLSMTVDSVFPVTNDILFVFASKLTDGQVSEKAYLYTYSLMQDAFTGNSMPIGIIGQYPSVVFKDGTVMVLTLNTETYEFETMLFINPSTLSYEENLISGISEIRSIYVSPDKKMAAVSTYDGLTITDISFEKVYAEYKGFTPEGGDASIDYHLPCAVGWLPDGSGIVGRMLGGEWVYNPFIFYVDGSMTDLLEYEYLSGIPCQSSSLLLYDYFTSAPKGILDISSLLYTPLSIDGLPTEEDTSYISAISFSPNGDMVAIAVSSPQDDDICTTGFYQGSVLSSSFSISKSGNYPVSFESVSFTPSGKMAILMTSATVDAQKAIYYMSLYR